MNKKWNTRKYKGYKGGNKTTIGLYKELLSSYAYSDAKHDFKDIYVANKSYIIDSIPTSPYKEYTEKSLLKTIKINSINNIKSTFKFDIDNIIEKYNSNDDMLFMDMTINNLKRTYMVHVVKYQENNNILVKSCKYAILFWRDANICNRLFYYEVF